MAADRAGFACRLRQSNAIACILNAEEIHPPVEKVPKLLCRHDSQAGEDRSGQMPQHHAQLEVHSESASGRIQAKELPRCDFQSVLTGYYSISVQQLAMVSEYQRKAKAVLCCSEHALSRKGDTDKFSLLVLCTAREQVVCTKVVVRKQDRDTL
jgi:hypothetical protein